MRLILAAMFLLLSFTANAGSAGQAKAAKCNERANMVVAGVVARYKDIPLDFVWSKPEKHMQIIMDYRKKSGNPNGFPTDRFYIRDDDETPDQKKAIEEAVTNAWHFADNWIKSGKDPIDPEQLFNELMVRCMNNQEQESSIEGFKPVASSQRLMEENCQSQAATAKMLDRLVKHYGKSYKEARAMMQQAHQPRLDEARLEKYEDWSREHAPEADFLEWAYKRCMGGEA